MKTVMVHKRCLLTLALALCWCSFLQAQYELVEAFPNVSFDKPVLLTFGPHQTNRVFVVEQDGRILVFENDPDVTSGQVQTFLDITGKLPGGVAPFGEYGLLGLAFHPNYAENGTFFVNYVTTQDGIKTHISKYQVSESNPDAADPASETVLLEIDQILDNHNAGMLSFGNDGYLYASLGDGGWQYPSGPPDPGQTAQDLTNLLGKFLRIDVDNPAEGLAYGIPADNPFAGNDQGYREEIFAYGFRNPWRFNIDHVTGKIWVGDVGFASWEEVNIVESGKNYGWSQAEGMDCRAGVNCNLEAYAPPVYVYANGAVGCSITGGAVYRGPGRPELVGKYIYGDWCAGRIWSLEDNGDGSYTNTLLTDEDFRISAFGQDANHELYIVALDFSNATKIYKFQSLPNSVEEPDQVVKSFSLLPNYPNPFPQSGSAIADNPSTNIPYRLEIETEYELEIFNMRGQRVRLVESGRKTPGTYTAFWNGRNDSGELVGSGVYLIRLKSGNRLILRRATLLK
jgi:glucose/arabinose dehydrogenase